MERRQSANKKEELLVCKGIPTRPGNEATPYIQNYKGPLLLDWVFYFVYDLKPRSSKIENCETIRKLIDDFKKKSKEEGVDDNNRPLLSKKPKMDTKKGTPKSGMKRKQRKRK